MPPRKRRPSRPPDRHLPWEEIQSGRKELQASREELKSTGEELTTSKGELQSLNEELQTVNQIFGHHQDQCIGGPTAIAAWLRRANSRIKGRHE